LGEKWKRIAKKTREKMRNNPGGEDRDTKEKRKDFRQRVDIITGKIFWKKKTRVIYGHVNFNQNVGPKEGCSAATPQGDGKSGATTVPGADVEEKS